MKILSKKTCFFTPKNKPEPKTRYANRITLVRQCVQFFHNTDRTFNLYDGQKDQALARLITPIIRL